jgi:hypothetical protein
MTQAIVNFVTSLAPTAGSTLPIVSQVFDFEISKNAQAFYSYNMGQIQSVFNTINTGGTPTAAQEQQFIASLNVLNQWAGMKYVDHNGVQQPASGTPLFDVGAAGSLTNPTMVPPLLSATGNASTSTPITSLDTTMNSYMAQALQNVNGILGAVIGAYRSAHPSDTIPDIVHGAIDTSTGKAGPVSSTNSANLDSAGKILTKLKNDNSIYQFANLTQAAINSSIGAQLIGDAFTGSTSIQQALAVDFVSRGNEILFNEMTQLNDALNTNQGVLGYLNSLQALMNQKDPQQFIKQLGLLSTSNAALTDTQYNNYESSTYNSTLGTQAQFAGNLTGYEQSQGGLAQSAFGSPYNASGPPTSYAYLRSTLTSNLTALINQTTASSPAAPGKTPPSQQLKDAMTSIINDLNSLPDSDAGVQTWVQDVQSGKEGQFQTSLNNAITAAQSFNDVQRQQLSNVMFVFQQFYQSASSLLSNLNNLIQKISSQMNK